MSQPWLDYDRAAGYKPDPANSQHMIWNCAEYPYVVRWSVSVPDRLTRWITHNRQFRTLEEAIAAYRRPFRGLDVDLVKHNGGPPGRHLDTLARRKARQPTRWSDAVPAELRG